jgi:hypothetical protein
LPLAHNEGISVGAKPNSSIFTMSNTGYFKGIQRESHEILYRKLSYFILIFSLASSCVIAAAKLPNLAGLKFPSQIGQDKRWLFGKFVKNEVPYEVDENCFFQGNIRHPRTKPLDMSFAICCAYAIALLSSMTTS